LSKTLKQRNQPQLVTFTVVNVVVLSVIALGTQRMLSLADDIANGSWSTLGKVIAIPAVAALLLGIIGWAVPREWKETVIFWRLGERCLPSSRAFSQIATSDPRIDAACLTDQFGSFPIEPSKQTAAWYSIYRRHVNEPSVEDAHGAYLLYREMAGLVGVSLIADLIVGICFHFSWKPITFGESFLVIEYFVVTLAARHSGEHLVANVLAIQSALDCQSHQHRPRKKTGLTNS
jgi:hypothetical protein